MRGSGGGAVSARAEAGGEDLAIKYLEFCVNELKLKVGGGEGGREWGRKVVRYNPPFMKGCEGLWAHGYGHA